MMSNQFSEDALVGQPDIALFAGLGWETANYLLIKALNGNKINPSQLSPNVKKNINST